jgi:ribonuclease P protein component
MAVAGLPLPRSSRIKQRGDFLRAKARGERVVFGCLIANVLARPDATGSRLGVVTSRKIGGAVIRSRARRLLREAYRRHQHELPRPMDVILVARQSIVGKKLADVERDYLQSLRRTKLAKTSE